MLKYWPSMPELWSTLVMTMVVASNPPLQSQLYDVPPVGLQLLFGSA
eukprot:SAG11_NODE_6554_length_1289_cov_3.355462_2_plen_46_part_01